MTARAFRLAPLALASRGFLVRINKSLLTEPSLFLMSASGTPLPNERLLSGRIDHDRDADRAAIRAAFFVRALRQAPRLDPLRPQRCISRPLAPCQRRQGEAQARH